MKTKIAFIVLANLLIACGANNPKNNRPSEIKTTKTALINEGAICLYTKKNHDIRVFYFPLQSTCTSSSLNKWQNKKLTASATFRRSIKGSIIEIESSVTHIATHSRIATADCAGAGIQSKEIKLSASHHFDVLWGGRSIGEMTNKPGLSFCKSLDKNGNVSNVSNQLSDYARRFGEK